MHVGHSISGEQLHALVECSGKERLDPPEQLKRIVTPLMLEVWRRVTRYKAKAGNNSQPKD